MHANTHKRYTYALFPSTFEPVQCYPCSLSFLPFWQELYAPNVFRSIDMTWHCSSSCLSSVFFLFRLFSWFNFPSIYCDIALLDFWITVLDNHKASWNVTVDDNKHCSRNFTFMPYYFFCCFYQWWTWTVGISNTNHQWCYQLSPANRVCLHQRKQSSH